MLSNHLILCHPLLPLPSIFPSIRIFSNESVIRWPLSISPSKEYSWVISFRINQFDLLAVEGTLKSLFQHHNFKASIFWCSAFFMVQLSHPHMTTGKNHLGSKITADGDCSHEIKSIALWKERYDKPRWCTEKQRHEFADKGLTVQFSSVTQLYLTLCDPRN